MHIITGTFCNKLYRLNPIRVPSRLVGNNPAKTESLHCKQMDNKKRVKKLNKNNAAACSFSLHTPGMLPLRCGTPKRLSHPETRRIKNYQS